MLVIDLRWAQSLDCRPLWGMVSRVTSEHPSPQKQSSPSMQPPGPWLGAQEQWQTTLLTRGPWVALLQEWGHSGDPRSTRPAPPSEGRRARKTFPGVPQGHVRGEEAVPMPRQPFPSTHLPSGEGQASLLHTVNLDLKSTWKFCFG